MLREVRARFIARPTGFAWVETGRLACSGYPGSRRQLAWASHHGIDAVLTLTEAPLREECRSGLPMTFEHVPMKDHASPDAATLDRGVETLRRLLRERRAVLVHCLAGEGRTGCVLAGYMVKDKGMDGANSLAAIRRVKRKFVERGQEAAVYQYASWVGSHQGAQG